MLERFHAPWVEFASGAVAKQLERLPLRPRRAVRACRYECVVHVADREDASRDVELLAAEAARIAGAVKPLVMVEDEPPDGLLETAELGKELGASLGMLLHDRELVIAE